MLNTGKLAGRVIFITGASRGIGKEIALKAARDGARIVVAAKTADPHPTLPGTIYTAAKEIEAAGGQALPCVVDVRDESAVQGAVQDVVRQFGGIDVVVNNASAISLTGTLETSMKKYDLMHNINTRGTYLVSKCCLPYLKKGQNPHILNISPPLNMNPRWFRDHVAYTMAKYGMSMCVLGMAQEFKADGIAVNALWPRTAIITAAMKMLGGQSVDVQCRKPEIMADAAYVMLTRDSRSYTGHFAIDDEVLRDVGVTDLAQYAVDPKATLLPDFFLDEALDDSVKDTFVQQGGQLKFDGGKEKAEAAAPAGDGKIAKLFGTIEGFLSEEIVQNTNAVYQFEVSGDDAGQWFLDLKNGSGSCGRGPASSPDATFKMSSDDFLKMFAGKLKPAAAFMTGKMKLSGDMGKAMKLDKLMGKLKSKL
ncbi:hydroxysteroid dehydrogenase-like protein 2 isoform X2 [Pollicipes pollicipes]|uniref:hydroxysteroid dehydrogenase-like protein 2 isoform X2 n=1 Tax=Pollicipes pollicipes TaxID=41117 RepID=UPI00188555D4|nr:hydroxysteroid dehydrogenase-like protein 2 isoform X2 [Pollicipes pollicipes]